MWTPLLDLGKTNQMSHMKQPQPLEEEPLRVPAREPSCIRQMVLEAVIEMAIFVCIGYRVPQWFSVIIVAWHSMVFVIDDYRWVTTTMIVSLPWLLHIIHPQRCMVVVQSSR